MTTERFELRNTNGLIQGLITHPATAPKGCLLCLHGSPNGDFHGNAFIFDQVASRIVPLGYAVVQFSFFGSSPSGGTSADSCLRSQLIDYRSLLEFVQQTFSCPIHICGESAGATIASLEWYAAAASYILLWPAFDLRNTDLSPYLTADSWTCIETNGYLETSGVVIGRAFFLELLFTDFSQSFQLPSQDKFIAHGQGDVEVPYSQSLRALQYAGGRTHFISHATAGHGFKEPEARAFLLDTIEQWFRTR